MGNVRRPDYVGHAMGDRLANYVVRTPVNFGQSLNSGETELGGLYKEAHCFGLEVLERIF